MSKSYKAPPFSVCIVPYPAMLGWAELETQSLFLVLLPTVLVWTRLKSSVFDE